jgi:hypothetical protein
VPAGRLFVLAAESIGGGPSTTVLVPTNCDTETVTVQAGCNASNGGQTPDEFTIRADGFGPGDSAEVSVRRLSGGDDLYGQSHTVDGEGRIRRTLGTNGYGAGDYQVTVEGGDHYAIGWFILPCPTLQIRLEPDCSNFGNPPDRFDVRVVATGFHPNDDAWIVWDGPRAHEFWTSRTDGNGRLALVISPYERSTGQYSLRVRTDNGESAIRQRTVSFDIPCEPTAITASQICGRPALQGDDPRRLSFEVSGTGFDRGALVIVFDADEISAAESFPAEADALGRFSQTITPLAPPMGAFRIVARQQPGGSEALRAPRGQLLEAETEYRSPCDDRDPPPLTLDPVCGPQAPETPEAYEITVRGAGYYPRSDIVVTFGQTDEFAARAESDGTFETTILASGKTASLVPLRAQQRDTLGQLAAGAAARFEVPCPIDPSIAIAPLFGPAGYTTTVTGTDFEPGSTVSLGWDRGITADQPLLVEVDADGSFEVHVFILPNDWPGERTLSVGLADDPEAFPDVEGTYTVTPGSGVPPRGSRDGIVSRR